MDRFLSTEPSDARVDRLWHEFSTVGRVPRGAIREALDDWDALAPAFLARLEAYVADPLGREEDAEGLAVAIHLFAQMRDPRAYRPLIALVSLPVDAADAVLGDEITETLHRIAASVFDGDPRPMQEAILARGVDEYVAHALFDAHTFLTGEGRIALGEMRLFLERCLAAFRRSDDDEVRWVAWQRAISYLGLTEYVPQVREVFDRGWITEFYMGFSDFERDQARALKLQDEHDRPPDREFGYFGDAIEEFSHWYGFSPAFLRDQEAREREERARQWREEQAAIAARWKNTGRNEPCPCGSDRKYKKCCLGKPQAQPAGLA